MWTKVEAERLKFYVENRYFVVSYKEHEIFGVDVAPDDQPIGLTALYLEPYDDIPPDKFVSLEDIALNEIEVKLLKPVPFWYEQDPNWQEADEETYNAYVMWKKEQQS